MKKAILGILMLVTVPTLAQAQAVPEHYRSNVILNYCGSSISDTQAQWIQKNYFRFKGTKRFLVNASYKAYILGGDSSRLKNYCDNLLSASEDLRN